MSKLFKVGDKVQRINKIEGKTMRGSADFWQLIAEADELPPAPTSVSYLKDDGRRKLVAKITGGSVTLLLNLRKVSTLAYSLDPDAALQLAHDLRRMAMDIKRKEKAL